MPANCPLCHVPGSVLYDDLRDRLYNAPGQWTLRRCPNPNCAIAWLDPMPSESDLAAAYRDYFTHPSAPSLRRRALRYVKTGYLAGRYGYRADSVSAPQRAIGRLACLAPFRRAGLDVLVQHLSALPRGRLLDVGCGDGQIVEFMDGLGWQAEGVDFDAAAIAAASRKGLRVHVGTLHSRNYGENTFDALVMSHFIEHVLEPAALLAKCRRILRPGGRLIILTPNLASWGHNQFGRAWFALDPPRHLHLFTPAALRGLVERKIGRAHV